MSPILHDLKSGDRIGEYILLEKIGSGGFAEVWKARHCLLETRVVALKIPLEPEYIRVLKREGILQHRLDHPHVVKILGIDTENDPPFLVMEYVEGKNLRTLIQDRGALPLEEAMRISIEILDLLRYAHERGVVHRDIKPENILLTPGGEVKVTDFGLGKVVQETGSALLVSGSFQTAEGQRMVGTINYMSPEQKDPSKTVDHRTDIYSFGILFFELLTGEIPQGGEVPSELNPRLGPPVDRIFKKCYARVDRRYPNVEKLLAEVETLREAVRPKPPPIPSPSKALPSPPPFRLQWSRRGCGRAAAAVSGYLWPAGFWVRSVAFLVDLLFLGMVLPAMGSFMKIQLGGPLGFFLYFALCEWLWGMTFGKWVMGIRVISGNGEELCIFQAAVRTLVKFLSVFFTMSLICIFMLFNFQRRGLHDFLADTRVVYRRA